MFNYICHMLNVIILFINYSPVNFEVCFCLKANSWFFLRYRNRFSKSTLTEMSSVGSGYFTSTFHLVISTIVNEQFQKWTLDNLTIIWKYVRRLNLKQLILKCIATCHIVLYMVKQKRKEGLTKNIRNT
jgi:hypothetical protein